MSKEFYKISLGKSEAEGEKQSLYKYFFPTKAYLIAKGETNNRKLFYIGHRGAGKSALFNQLVYEYSLGRNNIIIQMSPTQYSYEVFKKMEHNFFDIKAAYGVAWHYTLLIKIFFAISDYFESHPQFKKNRDNVDCIKKYLKTNGYLEEGFGLSVLSGFLRKLDLSKINVKGGENKVIESDRQLAKHLNMKDVTAPLSALNNILATHPLYIFIDELDTGWNNTDEAKNFLIGLFTAVYEINRINNIQVFVSLRQDMYDNLLNFLPNTEKMRDDMEFLSWDKQNLKSLLSKRILSNLPDKFNEMYTDESLQILFDNSGKVDEKVIDFIINHTMYRPREVIQFCNECLDEYVKRYNKPFQWLYTDMEIEDYGKKIDFEIVKNVEYKFSNYRLEDFCKEYDFELPKIRFVLLRFEGCMEFFSKEEFFIKLEHIMLEFTDKFGIDNWIGETELKAEKLMEILFKIGFIKIYVPSYNKYRAYYQTTILNFDKVEK
jgi:hypothetical protein